METTMPNSVIGDAVCNTITSIKGSSPVDGAHIFCIKKPHSVDPGKFGRLLMEEKKWSVMITRQSRCYGGAMTTAAAVTAIFTCACDVATCLA
jgi:hypothetical protein